MVNLNKLLIVAMTAIALVAIAGMANAATVTADKVQINGAYISFPKTVISEFGIQGFEYTLVPDGTFTVIGTITNDDDTQASVRVSGGPSHLDDHVVTVPASSSSSFSVTFPAASHAEVCAFYWNVEGWTPIGLTGVEFVDMPDNTEHTVNQGPMSDAVAIFTNGVMYYSGKPAFMVGYGHL